MTFRHLGTSLFAFVLTSCVNVSVAPPKSQKAQSVIFSAPSSPFVSLNKTDADQAWINERSANTISYLSQCQQINERTIKDITAEALLSLDESQVLQETKLRYNEREALKTVAHGKVDGVDVKIQVVAFKKNDCDYLLTFTGLEKSYSLDTAAFEKFLESFKAP